MKSSSKLLAAAGQSSFTESNNNPMAMVPYQGQSVVTSGAYSGTAADTSLVMKQTFESLNARDLLRWKDGQIWEGSSRYKRQERPRARLV